MNDELLFSIVIPTYNRALLLHKTLLSFIAQDYKNFEVLVIDDGGNDNSAKVVEQFNDPRLKYFWKKNEERGAARNYGTKRARGAYINYFDSDDLAYPNHLQVAKVTIDKFENPELFHLGYQYIHSNHQVIKKFNKYDGNIVDYAIKTKLISPISLFIRSDIATEIPFYENRKLAASEDALQLCQLAARYKLYYNNTITSALIQHEQRSMSTAKEYDIMQRKETMLSHLACDDTFVAKFGKYMPDIEGEFYYLLTLSCLFNKEYIKAKKYFHMYFKLTGFKILNIRNLVFLNNYMGRYFPR